jgi:hypothetical protein
MLIVGLFWQLLQEQLLKNGANILFLIYQQKTFNILYISTVFTGFCSGFVRVMFGVLPLKLALARISTERHLNEYRVKYFFNK